MIEKIETNDNTKCTTFLDSFAKGYMRSQTETNKKVLRCFPQCRRLGHRRNGYCGTTVRVETVNSNIDIQYWGSFSVVESDPVSIGDIVNLEYFENKIETESKDEKIIWAHGIATQISGTANHFMLEFTPPQSSWVYSWWASHRSLSHLSHCFLLVGCVKLHDRKWQVVTIDHSPSFQIFSKSHAKSKKRDINEEEETSDTCSVSTEQGVKRMCTEGSHNLHNAAQTTKKFVAKEDKSQEEENDGWSWLFSLNSYSMERSINTSESPFFPQKQTLTLQQQRNLTLDRMASLCLYPEKLHKIQDIQSFTNAVLERNLHSKMQKLEKVFEEAFATAPLNNSFQRIVEPWATPSKVADFKSRCANELDKSFRWTPDFEYESFDAQHGLDRSFYAQFREVYRSIFENAIVMHGNDIESFFDVLQYLSERGVIRDDPFHPPSVRFAKRLFNQINGRAPFKPELYAAGKESFETIEQQENYSKDLLLLKRYQCQRKVLDSIREKAFILAIKSKLKETPVDSHMDLSGIWAKDLSTEQLDQGAGAFQGVIEKLAGSYVARILRASANSLTVRHTQESLVLTFQPMFSMCITLVYLLDGKFHQFSPNHPISHTENLIGISSPLKRQYVSFVDTETSSTCIFLDFDIPVSREKMKHLYPKFKCTAEDTERDFTYYRIISYRLSGIYAAQYNVYDYIVPTTATNMLSAAWARDLYQQRQSCPYLVDSTTNRYFRDGAVVSQQSSSSNNFDNDDFFDLLL